jgi:acyl-CoA reductase-like NAD-dependent aldehyde dehydrogenase
MSATYALHIGGEETVDLVAFTGSTDVGMG